MGFGSSPIHYKDVVKVKRRLQDVLNDLASLGLVSRYDDEGYWFDEAGFVLYAPDDIIKAVTVFKRGYYEEEAELASKI
jgi:hypothetical protein